jgi:hypothetical protein
LWEFVNLYLCILLGRKRIDLNFNSIDYHRTKTTGIN